MKNRRTVRRGHTDNKNVQPNGYELTDDELDKVAGASTVNFDLNSYLFVVGAGAIFNGGTVTPNVLVAVQH